MTLYEDSQKKLNPRTRILVRGLTSQEKKSRKRTFKQLNPNMKILVRDQWPILVPGSFSGRGCLLTTPKNPFSLFKFSNSKKTPSAEYFQMSTLLRKAIAGRSIRQPEHHQITTSNDVDSSRSCQGLACSPVTVVPLLKSWKDSALV